MKTAGLLKTLVIVWLFSESVYSAPYVHQDAPANGRNTLDDKIAIDVSLPELKAEIPDGKEQSLYSSLRFGEPVSFSEVTRATLKAFERYPTLLPESSADKALEILTNIVRDIEYKDPYQFKVAVEEALAKYLGKPLVYNDKAENPLDPFFSGKINCYSGTILQLLATRIKLGPERFTRENFVVVSVKGHTFLAKVMPDGKLEGIETTADGEAKLTFPKPIWQIHDLPFAIRIEDSDPYLIGEIFKDRLKALLSPAEDQRFGQDRLRKTALRHRIPLRHTEPKVAEELRKEEGGEPAAADNARHANARSNAFGRPPRTGEDQTRRPLKDTVITNRPSAEVMGHIGNETVLARVTQPPRRGLIEEPTNTQAPYTEHTKPEAPKLPVLPNHGSAAETEVKKKIPGIHEITLPANVFAPDAREPKPKQEPKIGHNPEAIVSVPLEAKPEMNEKTRKESESFWALYDSLRTGRLSDADYESKDHDFREFHSHLDRYMSNPEIMRLPEEGNKLLELAKRLAEHGRYKSMSNGAALTILKNILKLDYPAHIKEKALEAFRDWKFEPYFQGSFIGALLKDPQFQPYREELRAALVPGHQALQRLKEYHENFTKGRAFDHRELSKVGDDLWTSGYSLATPENVQQLVDLIRWYARDRQHYKDAKERYVGYWLVQTLVGGLGTLTEDSEMKYPQAIAVLKDIQRGMYPEIFDENINSTAEYLIPSTNRALLRSNSGHARNLVIGAAVNPKLRDFTRLQSIESLLEHPEIVLDADKRAKIGEFLKGQIKNVDRQSNEKFNRLTLILARKFVPQDPGLLQTFKEMADTSPRVVDNFWDRFAYSLLDDAKVLDRQYGYPTEAVRYGRAAILEHWKKNKMWLLEQKQRIGEDKVKLRNEEEKRQWEEKLGVIGKWLKEVGY